METSRAPQARKALYLFSYRVVPGSCSLIAALGCLDTLVFTGGVDEHAANVRASIC